MKNQRELMQALLDGETLIYKGNGVNEELHLNKNGNAFHGTSSVCWSLSEPEKFSIKPKEITITKNEMVDILSKVSRLEEEVDRNYFSLTTLNKLFNNNK